MSGDIDIQFSVDDAAAFRAWQRQQAAAKKMKAELDALKKSGNEAGKFITDAAKNAMNKLAGAAAALTGIGGVVGALMAVASQIRAEIANIRSRQQEAAGAQMSVGKELAQALDNVGSAMDPVKFRQTAIDRSVQARIPTAELLNVVGAGAAAVGVKNEAEVMKLFDLAPKIAKASPHLSLEERGQAAGGIASLAMKAKMSDEEAIGIFKGAGNVHRAATTEMMVSNVLPAIPSLMALGMNPGEAVAGLGAFSQRMEDSRGAESSTAQINVAKNLAQRYPNLPDYKSRLAKVQNDPAEIEKYFKGGSYDGVGKMPGASMEQGAFVAINELIRGQKMAADYAANVASVGGKDNWRKSHDDSIAAFAKMPEIQALELESTFRGGVQGIQLARTKEGASAIGVDGLSKTLKAAGMSDLGQKIEDLKVEFARTGGIVPLEHVIKTMRRHAEQLEAPTGVTGHKPAPGINGGMMAIHGPRPDLATQEGIATAAQEKALADALEDQDRAMQAVHFGTVVSSARAKTGDLGALESQIRGDSNFTAEEATAAQSQVEAARSAVKGLAAEAKTNPAADAAVKELIQQGERQIQLMEQLIKATMGNKPTAPAGGMKPALPKNSQASSGQDRRNRTVV